VPVNNIEAAEMYSFVPVKREKSILKAGGILNIFSILPYKMSHPRPVFVPPPPPPEKKETFFWGEASVIKIFTSK
jgi:hypothetical protein